MKVLIVHVADDNTLKLVADLLRAIGDCNVEEIEAPKPDDVPICIVCGAAEGDLRVQIGGGMRTVRLVVGQSFYGQQICGRCLEDARGRAREYKSKKEPKQHRPTYCDCPICKADGARRIVEAEHNEPD